MYYTGIGKRNGNNGGIPPSELKQWGNFEVNGGFSICGTVVTYTEYQESVGRPTS